MNDGDVAAQALDDLKDVRGEKDGGSAGDHSLEHGLERAGRDGVDAFERLIEEENLGSVNDRGGQRKFLLHAVGVVGDEFLRLVGELHEIEQLGGALSRGDAIEAVHASGEAEKLRAR